MDESDNLSGLTAYQRELIKKRKKIRKTTSKQRGEYYKIREAPEEGIESKENRRAQVKAFKDKIKVHRGRIVQYQEEVRAFRRKIEKKIKKEQKNITRLRRVMRKVMYTKSLRRALCIKKDENNFYTINWYKQGGEISPALKGLYSSKEAAITAIKAYYTHAKFQIKDLQQLPEGTEL